MRSLKKLSDQGMFISWPFISNIIQMIFESKICLALKRVFLNFSYISDKKNRIDPVPI